MAVLRHRLSCVAWDSGHIGYETLHPAQDLARAVAFQSHKALIGAGFPWDMQGREVLIGQDMAPILERRSARPSVGAGGFTLTLDIEGQIKPIEFFLTRPRGMGRPTWSVAFTAPSPGSLRAGHMGIRECMRNGFLEGSHESNEPAGEGPACGHSSSCSRVLRDAAVASEPLPRRSSDAQCDLLDGQLA